MHEVLFLQQTQRRRSRMVQEQHHGTGILQRGDQPQERRHFHGGCATLQLVLCGTQNPR